MTTALDGFPTAGPTYALLTTGDARLAGTPNDAPGAGANDGGNNVRGTTDFDVTILRVDLNVPENDNCLVGMDFRFLSEEYPEYVGSEFNDAFIAEIDHSTWTTTDSAVSAPDNFAFDPSGNPITINSTGPASMSAAAAAGTTYDGATPLLSASSPVSPGRHSLYLSIFDQGDHALDSAVMIDRLRLGHVNNVETQCKPGAHAGNETVTTASATPATVAFGNPVTIGAHVAKADQHAGVPSGTVSFYLNGASSPMATLPIDASGSTSFVTNGLPAGADSIVAIYSGDSTFGGSTSDPVTVNVGARGCTISGNHVGTITVAQNQSVTLCNATVRGSVVVQNGGAVDIENSTIRDAVVSFHTRALRMCGSSSQLVAASTSDGFVMVGDPDDGCATNVIHGDLYLKDNTHGVQVIDNVVTGTVTDQNNTGAGPFPTDTVARVIGNGAT